MSNVVVKESSHKIDHPSRDPNRHISERAAKKRLKSMKFESEGEKRDYEKRVAANPFNIYGNPALYPPISIRSAMNDMRPAVTCKTDGCGGCCTYLDGWKCPRCKEQNLPL